MTRESAKTAAVRRLSAIAGVMVMALGWVVLAGWIFHVPSLKKIHPSFVSMKANTAIAFIALGLALFLARYQRLGRMRRAFATVVLVIAGLTIAEYLFGIHLGIDELLFRELDDGRYPGRMSPVVAVCFALLGSALALPDGPRAILAGQVAVLVAATSALVALCGYLYGVGSLYSLGPYSATALHTALGIFISSLAFLGARPNAGVMRLLGSDTGAGQLLRRVLPALFFLPIALGWLCLQGQLRGYYDAAFGLALMVLSNVLLLTVFTGWTGSILDRSERKLHTAFDEIRDLNQNLERRVDQRTRELAAAHQRLDGIISLAADAIISIDEDERITIFNKGAEKIFGWAQSEVVGRPLSILLPERFRAIHHRHIAGFAAEPAISREMSARRKVFGRRKSGEDFPAEAAISKLRLDGRVTFTVILRDITQRMRIEDKLQIFASLVENSSDFIGIADPDGKPIYVNPAGRRMVGLPLDTAVEHTQIPEYYPPEQYAFVHDVILKSMLEDGRWSGETYFRNWQTGEPIAVSDEHFIIQDRQTGRTLGLGTVTRDISEARRVSDQLRESEERFRLTIDEAPIGMALVALDGRFVRVNRALCEVVGYEPAELTRMTFQDITHPADLENDLALVERLRTGAIPRYQLEKRYLRKDGRIVDILLHASLLRDHDGEPRYYIAQIEDITERKRAQAALRVSEESLSLAVEASGQGLWDWNLVTDEALLSPRYWHLIGLGNGDRPHRADYAFFTSLIHPDDRPGVEEAMREHLEGKSAEAVIEYRARRPSGEYVWLRGIGRVMARDHEGKPLRMAGVIADISGQKRLEEERARSLREKETLLREIHHRVKNNLQVLSSLFYLQRQRTDQEPLRTLLDESRNRIQSIALIHEKLYQSEHLSRIDFGDYLNDLTTRLLSAFGGQSPQARVRVHAEGGVFLDIERAIPCALIANELVSNALKHAFPGRRSGEIHMSVGWDQPGWLKLTVSDDGVGFPPELDFKNTRTLGMQLVCSLATQLRGAVTMSRAGGTRFELRFPVGTSASLAEAETPAP